MCYTSCYRGQVKSDSHRLHLESISSHSVSSVLAIALHRKNIAGEATKTFKFISTRTSCKTYIFLVVKSIGQLIFDLSRSRGHQASQNHPKMPFLDRAILDICQPEWRPSSMYCKFACRRTDTWEVSPPT